MFVITFDSTMFGRPPAGPPYAKYNRSSVSIGTRIVQYELAPAVFGGLPADQPPRQSYLCTKYSSAARRTGMAAPSVSAAIHQHLQQMRGRLAGLTNLLGRQVPFPYTQTQVAHRALVAYSSCARR